MTHYRQSDRERREMNAIRNEILEDTIKQFTPNMPVIIDLKKIQQYLDECRPNPNLPPAFFNQLNLRHGRDRKTFINLMKEYTFMVKCPSISPYPSIICYDVVIVGNVLSFDLLIHHPTIEGMLLSTVRNPSANWRYFNLHCIALAAMSNRLILRYIFQSKRINHFTVLKEERIPFIWDFWSR